MFIDSKGGMHEVDAEDFGTSKADSLGRHIARCKCVLKLTSSVLTIVLVVSFSAFLGSAY